MSSKKSARIEARENIKIAYFNFKKTFNRIKGLDGRCKSNNNNGGVKNVCIR